MHSFWKNKAIGRGKKALSIQAAQGILTVSHFSCSCCVSFCLWQITAPPTVTFLRRKERQKLCCFIRTRWESFVEPSLPMSLFASRQQWIDMIILWCFGITPPPKKKGFRPRFFYVATASGSSAQSIRAKSVSISTLNVRELHLNIRTGVIGSYHYCFLTFPVFHVSQSFFC